MPIQVLLVCLAALLGVVVAVPAWFAHLIRVGTRDSCDLASKLAAPHPCRVADWPELRLESVVVDPDGTDRVLVCARWPAHPEYSAVLILEVEDSPTRATRLLAQWRDIKAPVSARPVSDERVLLRRRHSYDVVRARVLDETV